jgi:hypothetical protein
MGSRFVKTHDADRRAIELHLQLRDIEQLPNVIVKVSNDGKKIQIIDKSAPFDYNTLTVDRVLSFDVGEARRNGGSRSALLQTKRKKPIAIPSSELQDSVDEFLKGDDSAS